MVFVFLCFFEKFGYRPLGVRLDSGDLAYLSREVRKIFTSVGETYNIDYFPRMTIVASNDLSEKVLYALRGEGAVIREQPTTNVPEEAPHHTNRVEQGHEIDTCKKQSYTVGERKIRTTIFISVPNEPSILLPSLLFDLLFFHSVGVGTNLVTCKTQPALGCVYKLVEVNKSVEKDK